MKKLILFTLALFALQWFATDAGAQISNNWTTTIRARDLPTNVNRPTVAAISGNKTRSSWTMYLDASTYDNANDSTAFAALGAAVKTNIDSNYVVEIWGINPAADVTMRTVITYVHREWDAFNFSNLRTQYKEDEDVFKVVGYCEWVIPE